MIKRASALLILSMIVGSLGSSVLAPLLVSSANAAANAAVVPDISAHAIATNVLSQINALRASYGLGPGQLTTSYDSAVSFAAVHNEDPALSALGTSTVEGFGVWGLAPAASPTATPSPTSIVQGWVYKDGWMGSATQNLDCTGPNAPGCNGHRRAILSAPPRAGAQLTIDVGAYVTSCRVFRPSQ